jgi:hypothetical protein
MSQHLGLILSGKAAEESQGQNRTREIRRSGIAGGPVETCTMGVGLSLAGKPEKLPPNPNVVARHRSIPTDWLWLQPVDCRDETFRNGVLEFAEKHERPVFDNVRLYMSRQNVSHQRR